MWHFLKLVTGGLVNGSLSLDIGKWFLSNYGVNAISALPESIAELSLHTKRKK